MNDTKKSVSNSVTQNSLIGMFETSQQQKISGSLCLPGNYNLIKIVLKCKHIILEFAFKLLFH